MIYIRFIHFDVEGNSRCSYDSFKYYDGLPELGVERSVHCGDGAPDLWPSSGNVVVLKFSSDGSVNHQGFKLTYRTINSPRSKSSSTSDNELNYTQTSWYIEALSVFILIKLTKHMLLSIFLPQYSRCSITIYSLVALHRCIYYF